MWFQQQASPKDCHVELLSPWQTSCKLLAQYICKIEFLFICCDLYQCLNWNLLYKPFICVRNYKDTYRRILWPLLVALRIKIAAQICPMVQLIFGNNEAALIWAFHPGSTSACFSILQHNRLYWGNLWDICVDAGLKGIVCDGIKFRWFTLAFKTFRADNLITGIYVVTFLLNYEYLG